MVVLVDGQGRQFGAFVEIDLGSMSHTRLRQKAELYAAYADSNTWHGRHLFLPVLLFLTTTDTRGARLLRALARALSHSERHNGQRAFIAGAAGVAWAPEQLLAEACLADLDGNVDLSLPHVLNAARVPYEQALAYEREQEEAKGAQRRVLRDDPVAMRKLLAESAYTLSSYTQALGEIGEQAVELLRSATGEPSMEEREALRAIARDLDRALPEPHLHNLPSPGAAVRNEIGMLVEHYRSAQSRQVAALAERHGAGPSLRRANHTLREGLLDHATLCRLPGDAEHDDASRVEQHERHQAYLQWREHAARQLARQAGPLGRLTHRPEDFYTRLDRERLRVCGQCGETIYPPATPADSYGSAPPPSCHYCRQSHNTKPYTTATTETESEAYE